MLISPEQLFALFVAIANYCIGFGGEIGDCRVYAIRWMATVLEWLIKGF